MDDDGADNIYLEKKVSPVEKNFCRFVLYCWADFQHDEDFCLQLKQQTNK